MKFHARRNNWTHYAYLILSYLSSLYLNSLFARHLPRWSNLESRISEYGHKILFPLNLSPGMLVCCIELASLMLCINITINAKQVCFDRLPRSIKWEFTLQFTIRSLGYSWNMWKLGHESYQNNMFCHTASSELWFGG